jgi:AcrR family transcriptional regulator
MEKNERPNRQAKRLAATRRQILDAAAALIGERGYAAATVEEIAERADVAKGTLYYHFTSKEEIATALARADLATCVPRIEAALNSGASPLEVLRDLLCEGAAWIETHPDLARVAVTQTMLKGVEGDRDDYRSQPHMRVFFRMILAAGRTVGEIRTDIDMDVLHSVLTGFYANAVGMWLFSDGAFPLAKRLLDGLELFLQGAGVRGA